MPRLLAAAAVVTVLNMPFGYWRAGAPRFTRSWMLAVHTPVPLVVAVRLLAGLGWHLATFPVLVGAFFTGQLVGSLFRRVPVRASKPAIEPPASSLPQRCDWWHGRRGDRARSHRRY